MILDLVFAALNYAFAHALLALVVTPVTVVVVRRATRVPARTRAAIALGALMFLVIAPVGPGFVRWYASDRDAPAPVPDVPVVVHDAETGANRVVWGGAPLGALVLPVSLEVAGLAFLAWGAGTLWQLARIAAGAAASRRAIARGVRARALEARYGARLPAGTRIHLTASLGPAALGIVRPTIVLPAALAEDLPGHALSAVLLHEGAHLARRDPAALLAQRAIEALFWWNPLVRLLGSACASARELASDARAAAACASPTAYATGLVDAVSILLVKPASGGRDAVNAVGSGDDLDERIQALIDARAERPEAAGAIVVVLSLALTAAIVGLHLPWPRFGMWHPGAAAAANAASDARSTLVTGAASAARAATAASALAAGATASGLGAAGGR